MIADAAHNPAGMAVTVQALAESFNFERVIGVVAVMEDKDVAGMLDELEPRCPTSWSPRTPRRARCRPPSWPSSRSRSSARTGSRSPSGSTTPSRRRRRRLDAEAVARGLPGGGAVLVTGSVATAGDAQLLLAPDRRSAVSANPRRA